MHSFSVIIPVLDESSMINKTVGHVYHLAAGFDVELIVVDGDSKGKTIKAVRDKRVIKVVSPKGRGQQMNKGASAAKGDILLFLHTDTELPDNAFRLLSSVIDDGRYAGGAFDLGIQSDRTIFRLIEKLVFVRTRLTGIPYGDQGIFIKKECFDKVGCFEEIPLMEDVELMQRIKRSGYEICIIPHKVKTSARRWEKEGVFYCTMRNWALISLYHLGIEPEKLVRYYYRDWKDE